ncbi:MAG: hypothetical protein ACOYXC_05660 [Candidatus Rifleibacteriota bacterium]
MDQARWLIILSVVVVMSTILALLHRFSDKGPQIVAPIESPAEFFPKKNSEPALDSKLPAVSRPIQKIRYSKPPSHSFSVETRAEFTKEGELIKDKGKIIK